MKVHSSPEAYCFEDLMILMYNNQDDKEFLYKMQGYIILFKHDYCLVHLYTMMAALSGYLNDAVRRSG